MKHRFSVSSLLRAALLSVAALSPFSSQGANLELRASTPLATPGEVVTIDIAMSALGSGTAPSIGSLDLVIGYDASVFDFLSASFGDPLQADQLDVFGLGGITSITPSIGSIGLFELSLDTEADLNSLQAGSFIFASLAFTAHTVGTSAFNVSINTIADAVGDPLPVLVASPTISVSVVPELPVMAMLIPGLMVVALSRRLRPCAGAVMLSKPSACPTCFAANLPHL